MEVYLHIIRIWKTTQDFINLESDLDRGTRKSTNLTIKKMKFSNTFQLNGKFFEDYLKTIISKPAFVTGFGPIHVFLQISGFNKFMDETIDYQSVLKKKVGGQYTTNRCWKCVQDLFKIYRKRWFAISSEGVCYAKKYALASEGVIDMLFFDRSVKIRFGMQATGQEYGIILLTRHHNIHFIKKAVSESI